MALLYDRQIEVEIAGLIIREPRITLDISRAIDATQDKGEVLIYNLTPGHERQIEERGDRISISAGYRQTLSTIFAGGVQRVTRERSDLSQITRIQTGDMVHDSQSLGGVFSATYEGEVSVRTVATDIITQGLGLSVGPLDAIPPDATIPDFPWGTSAAAALTVLLRRVNCRWYESDGIIRINRAGMVQPDAAMIRVTPDTGLIGRPAVTDEGAELRIFLDSRVTVGCRMEVESDTLTGAWKVVAMQIQADNWDGQFDMKCELRPLSDD